ncbi:MAG: hypothetical protein VCB07_06350 [Gammaproteobacteria bacterium]
MPDRNPPKSEIDPILMAVLANRVAPIVQEMSTTLSACVAVAYAYPTNGTGII